ncbi:hypothetical protein CJO94_18695 (plasmid) [Ralstonia solanacearum]|nr:hypothetical protein CJO94_18695 [Ralstonia solanacearum]
MGKICTDFLRRSELVALIGNVALKAGGDLTAIGRNVTIDAAAGTTHHDETHITKATRNQGSTLMAGGKATLSATGAKDANGNPVAGTGNLTIAGSGVSAKDVVLGTANSVNLND